MNHAGTTSEAQRRPARRLLRISLSVLLVLIALVAVWLARVTNRARRQAEVMAELWASQSIIGFDYEYPRGTPFDPSRRIRNAQLQAPLWLWRFLGDEYFRSIVMVVWNWQGRARSANTSSPVSWSEYRDDAFLRKLIGLGRLKYLDLTGPEMSGQVLRSVSGLTELESFGITSCASANDDSLAFLAGLHRLRNLNITNCPITDRTIEQLARRPALEGLFLQSSLLTDQGLASLRKLDRLERLSLEIPKITDRGLAHLVSLQRLKLLRVSSRNIGDAGLLHIAKLTNLSRLNFIGQVTDDGIAALLPLQQLNELRIASTSATLTDRALEPLKQLKRLKGLSLGDAAQPGTEFSDEALLELINALPALTSLSLEPQYLKRAVWKPLQKTRPTLRIWSVK